MSSSAQLIAAERGERHVFVVCGGRKCRDAGSGALFGLLSEHRCQHHADTDLRIGQSETCIGHCAAAPAMVEDGRLLGWVSLRRLRSELMRLGILRPSAA